MRIMKNFTNLFLMAAFSLGMVACSSDQDVPVVSNGELQTIEVTLDETDATTRTTSVVNSSNPDQVLFTFSNKDTLGIFTSAGGPQLSFPISGSGSSASFTGGGWGLKSAYTYAAYIPFSKKNYDRTNKTIPLNYVGQTPTGLNNADHMGAYDYQASAGVHPVNDKANISLKRQGAIIVLKLKMPEAATITSATISVSGGSIFIKENNLDISGTAINISAKSANKSTKTTLLLNNCTTVANQEFRLYMMAGIPVSLASKTLRVGVRTNTGEVYYAGLSKYYPTDKTDWTANTRFCYSATLRKFTGADPSAYVDDITGTLDQPAVTVPDPGAWN